MAELLSFGDQLKVEGINFKGFGIIPKYAMMDRELSLEAKSIYSYFCAFAGSGNSAFPGRSKILSDLSVGKSAYYTHYNQLIEQGYITCHQKREQKFCNNIYTLVSNPKKFSDPPESDGQSKIYSTIKMSGLKAAGYGVIPKSVMLDPRLPLKSKGIYAYFASLTGGGEAAFPKKSTILYHLGITENTYYKYCAFLVDLNYLTIKQRYVNGRLGINDYYLNDNPDESKAQKKTLNISPTSEEDRRSRKSNAPKFEVNTPDKSKISANSNLKNQDTRKQDTIYQDTANQDPTDQDTSHQDTTGQNLKNQDTRERDTIINRTINNNSNNSISYNQQSFTPSASPMRREGGTSLIKRELLEIKRVPYSYASSFSTMSDVIHAMTDWDILHPSGYDDQFEQSVYELFNQALIDMCTSNRSMKLKSSLVKNTEVIDQLNSIARFENDYIDLSDLSEPAMQNYIEGAEGSDIRNPLQYMKSCIWDAMLSGNIKMYQSLRKIGY